MDPILAQDKAASAALLAATQAAAEQFLKTLPQRPAAAIPTPHPLRELPETGVGGAAALAVFMSDYAAELSGSAGPRYFGYVTGGATPAAVMGDWLTSVIDQNAAYQGDSISEHLEAETIDMLRQLFGLSAAFSGIFVSGATMANVAGLALGRQWLGEQAEVDIAQEGLHAIQPVIVLAAAPHVTIYKALALLGIGRDAVQLVPKLPGREAADVSALRQALTQVGRPCIVSASAGTVNTGDFDDIAAIAALREEIPFWLHVDGAFGGFAAANPQSRHLTAGMDAADSITIDAHKWLNVPYDSAMSFNRHPNLQFATFHAQASYLGEPGINPAPVHLSPQSSRRLRALAAWFTLLGYGRAGHAEIVARNCEAAAWLGERIAASAAFELLAPVRLNVVCFTLAGATEMATVTAFLQRLQADGRAFMTPTMYAGRPAIRAAVSNWQTTLDDMEICWQALQAIEVRPS